MSSNEAYCHAPYSPHDVNAAFKFWSEDLSKRSDGSYIAIDPNDSTLSPETQHAMNLNVNFYDALDLGATPEGHDRIKQITHGLAEKILQPGDFDKLVKAFQGAPGLQEQMRSFNDRQENFAIGLNHRWLTNAAIAQAALYCALDEPGQAANFILSTSKTLGFLEAVIEKDDYGRPTTTLPAIDAMRLTTNISCSVPRSSSLERPELQVLQTFGNDYNQNAVRPLVRHAAKPGSSVWVSNLSGSLDAYDPVSKTIVMKPVEKIMSKLLTKYYPNVLPIVMELTQDHRLLFSIGQFKEIKCEDDVHSLMQGMASSTNDLVGDQVEVRYKDPRPAKLMALGHTAANT